MYFSTKQQINAFVLFCLSIIKVKKYHNITKNFNLTDYQYARKHRLFILKKKKSLFFIYCYFIFLTFKKCFVHAFVIILMIN